jgi:hypothetical protein
MGSRMKLIEDSSFRVDGLMPECAGRGVPKDGLTQSKAPHLPLGRSRWGDPNRADARQVDRSGALGARSATDPLWRSGLGVGKAGLGRADLEGRRPSGRLEMSGKLSGGAECPARDELHLRSAKHIML